MHNDSKKSRKQKQEEELEAARRELAQENKIVERKIHRQLEIENILNARVKRYS